MMRRAALYLLPVVVGAGLWLGFNRAREPVILPMPVEAAIDPVQAIDPSQPAQPAPKEAEAAPVVEQQAVVERVAAVVEPKKAATPARVIEPAKTEPAPAIVEPPVEAPKRKPVKEQAPPKMTVPAADLERAARASQEGMKALISGRLPSAIESFREATNAAPRYALAWRGLGLANEKMGRKSEALDAFEQYLRLSSGEDARVVREVEQRVEKLRGL